MVVHSRSRCRSISIIIDGLVVDVRVSSVESDFDWRCLKSPLLKLKVDVLLMELSAFWSDSDWKVLFVT